MDKARIYRLPTVPTFGLVCLAALLGLLVGGCSEVSAPPLGVAPSIATVVTTTTVPTMVLVVADDMGPDLFTRAIMPLTYAALVDSGTLYTNAHANNPVCCASRATILRTQPEHVHGVVDNAGPGGGAPAFNDQSTLATSLRGAGWRTAIVGKYLNLYNRLPWLYVAPGWDEWRVMLLSRYWSYQMVEKAFDTATVALRSYGTLAKDHSTNRIKRAALDVLRRSAATVPVFLYLTPLAPHHPWTAQLSDVGSCNAIPYTPDLAFNEADVSDKPPFVQALPLLTATQIAQLQSDWRKQCETLKGVDRLIHDVVQELRVSGRLATATIVFTSDHGVSMGRHRLFERKKTVYDTPIPLVIRSAGQVTPAVVNGVVSLLDVSATLRRVAGLTAQAGMALQDGLPGFVLIEHRVTTPANEHVNAVRTTQHLYAEYQDGFVELYDLQGDPGMLVNRATDPAYAVIRATLAQLLVQAQQQP